MLHTVHPQLQENSHLRRVSHPAPGTFVREVVQDSPATPTAPPATPHSAPSTKHHRPVRTHPKTIPVQEANVSPHKVRVDLWVEPLVKAELMRLANANGLNRSQTGNALLKKALSTTLYEQHHALIEPVIREAIHTEMTTLIKRLSFLLVRVAYASEQTRGLVTNLLNYQTTITPDKLTAILSGSSKAAKQKIIENTPQIKHLMEELETIFLADEKGGACGSRESDGVQHQQYRNQSPHQVYAA